MGIKNFKLQTCPTGRRVTNSRRGFTLVELMIVITVIAILATIAIVSFTRVQKQARDTKRKAEMKSLQTALQAYYTEKIGYPVANTPTAATTALTSLSPTYISNLPTAPGGTTGTNSDYMYISDGSLYGICVQLEATATAGAMWKVDTGNAAGRELTNAGCTAQ